MAKDLEPNNNEYDASGKLFLSIYGGGFASDITIGGKVSFNDYFDYYKYYHAPGVKKVKLTPTIADSYNIFKQSGINTTVDYVTYSKGGVFTGGGENLSIKVVIGDAEQGIILYKTGLYIVNSLYDKFTSSGGADKTSLNAAIYVGKILDAYIPMFEYKKPNADSAQVVSNLTSLKAQLSSIGGGSVGEIASLLKQITNSAQTWDNKKYYYYDNGQWKQVASLASLAASKIWDVNGKDAGYVIVNGHSEYLSLDPSGIVTKYGTVGYGFHLDVNLETIPTGNTVNGSAQGDSITLKLSAPGQPTTTNYDDKIFAGAGNDSVIAGGGNDFIDGGAGLDTMAGGIGNDKYYVDNLGDKVIELPGGGIDTVISPFSIDLGATSIGAANVENITLVGSANLIAVGNSLANYLTGNMGSNTLVGKGGNDTLWGKEGDDYLDGGAGNDNLIASVGNDRVYGGAGADDLQGGVGADRFIFKSISDSTVSPVGRDDILDFRHLQSDKIDLSLIDAKAGTIVNDAFAFIGSSAFTGSKGQLHYSHSASGTFVSGDINGDKVPDFSIHIIGNIVLTSADFIL